MSSIFDINVNEYLNFALFLRDAAGLLRYQGYIGRDFRWPFNENEFLNEVGIQTFAEASQQWNEWWEELVLISKNEVINDTIHYSYLDDISMGKFKNLDKYQDLKVAAQWVFSRYLGWWTLPYAGGKSAIETHINNQANVLSKKWRIDNIDNEDERNFILRVVYPFKFESMIEKIDNKTIFGIIGVCALYENRLNI